MDIQVPNYEEGEREAREQLLWGQRAEKRGLLVNVVRVGDSKPREGQFKKPGGGKIIKGENVSLGGGYRVDGGDGNQMRVNIKCHGGAFVRRVAALPG